MNDKYYLILKDAVEQYSDYSPEYKRAYLIDYLEGEFPNLSDSEVERIVHRFIRDHV